MPNLLLSFRARMLLLFALSMLSSGLITYALFEWLRSYYREHAQYGDTMAKLRAVLDDIGEFNFILIVFVPLAILFFYLYTKPYATYFKRISQGIRKLAAGDFASRVDVRSGDEFEAIAEDVNRASDQLRVAIERGDFAENSKDRLILNLAHDLRTPLTSVLGYLDYVLHNEKLTEEQARHYTQIAYAKSRRVEKLIEELFEIARLNHGKLPVERRSIDLGELLGQLIEELYPIFESSGVVARLDAPAPVLLSGDGDLLARVFENLLTNAARYGKDGQFIDVRCAAEPGEAIVQVVNYGQAIPEDELPYLFDMFYKGDKARSMQGEGTGLGLFIAKNIVEQHAGAISADSNVIRTVFEVRLPREGQWV
ncbi:sensor histidine kinase [Cohnella sp. GCM10027633]|uniref:sensor histidine kinase n=1 Tax=unclassified Cohnella TaxID=2636738 RepID=UPI003633ECAA